MINVTLATPEKTPGKHPATVYILCPEFEVGASTDVWDEALSPEAKPKAKAAKGKRGSAGTIWDCGRNWTTVVLEIVPPALPADDDAAELAEDDFAVKVPILVRSVYEADIDRDDGIGKDVREKKEHSYWSVLEVGRIGRKTPNKVGFSDAGGGGGSSSSTTSRPASLLSTISNSSDVPAGPARDRRSLR